MKGAGQIQELGKGILQYKFTTNVVEYYYNDFAAIRAKAQGANVLLR